MKRNRLLRFEELGPREMLSVSPLASVTRLYPTASTPAAALVAPQASTSSYLYSSQSTANVGQTVSFTDYVYPNAGSSSPSGTVSVYDNGNFVTTANLVATGYGYSYVTWATSSLGVGSHTIRFAYNGNGSFQTSSASLTELIRAVAVNRVAQLGTKLLGSAYTGMSLGYLQYYAYGPTSATTYGGYHPGIDYYAPLGTAVYSPIQGTVANFEPT